MHDVQIALGGLNVVGGVLVIGSYLLGVRAHPQTAGQAWGGVPRRLKPFYVASMLTAAAGYFAFTYHVLFSIDPDEVEVLGAFGFGVFILIYALILLPSAIWMPLTFAMLDRPRRWLWWAIRITLLIVGLASLALVIALLTICPKDGNVVYWLAVAGSVAFAIQTALLDALVWPVYFPVKG
jgi:hypothetical protein